MDASPQALQRGHSGAEAELGGGAGGGAQDGLPKYRLTLFLSPALLSQ